MPRCTAEKPECSVARIGRPSGSPREHKHDLEKGLVVYGNTVLREEERRKDFRNEERTPRPRVEPTRDCDAEGQGSSEEGVPKYSIRDLSDGGIRVRFPDSWTPSKGERGKPGGGLRAAPFLFPPASLFIPDVLTATSFSLPKPRGGFPYICLLPRGSLTPAQEPKKKRRAFPIYAYYQGVVCPYLYLLLRRAMCTRVYTIVYTCVYNSVHACTLLRSKYVLCRVLICAFLGANV